MEKVPLAQIPLNKVNIKEALLCPLILKESHPSECKEGYIKVVEDGNPQFKLVMRDHTYAYATKEDIERFV